ncbi:Uncharacterised protein [Anaerococcus prevotii]|uniref:Uncharacterized protein n=1 Tax=Anaerococcus prevotii (strain ATCC 9321 / DSM 20548 / JCM 6508 / NCTC 11806 / PC1) TaxID=525919 RepID=C7RG07_ANAPD|nr:hypothetical protein [Anaerococcus prevotii]ACV28418.1 hypothetical protein Apre_0369 [Anaerococcus prevotii DSM 20548]SUU93977.1 Uncharacterised protein [Anaerococcus prevotii]
MDKDTKKLSYWISLGALFGIVLGISNSKKIIYLLPTNKPVK